MLTEIQPDGCPRCGEPVPPEPIAAPGDEAGPLPRATSPYGVQALPAGWRLADPRAAAALAALLEGARRAVPAGRTLEVAGDPVRAVYLVLDGWLVASRSTEAGQRQIVDFVLPGQLFDPASASAGRAAVDLSAQSDARVAVIARAEWRRLLRAEPGLRDLADSHAAAAFARIAERMLRLGKGSAETRLAHALCELALRAGVATGGAPRAFHLPLTQQALGDYAGLSSVHVSRTFRRFRTAGILSVENWMDIVVHDPDGLARVAGIDQAALGETVLPRP